MILKTYNVRGLGGLPKRRALREYIYSHSVQVLFLQETMVLAPVACENFLKICPDWVVIATESNGFSGGLLSAWDPRFARFKSFSTAGGILLEGHFKGFDGVLNLLNVYGPYKDRQSFWDHISMLRLLNLENLILGGDLNFTLGPSEVWGGRQADDPLCYYLADLFHSVDLVDVIADFSSPTWYNGREGVGHVAKRLDRFLISNKLLEKIDRYRTWVDFSKLSDHCPVSLQLDFDFLKINLPFKFNRVWLEEEEFRAFIRATWVDMNHLECEPDCRRFMMKLRFLKRLVIKWERQRKAKNRLELYEVEETIALLNEKIMTGSGADEDRKRLSDTIDSRNHLVHIKEETLLQKSRVRWMAEGDKNTQYFHKVANQRRIQKSIWELEYDTGGKIYK